MNFSDTERFASILEKIGLTLAGEWQSANILVINTCSVRQKAEDRITGIGSHIVANKKQNPTQKIVLTGCMARRAWQTQITTRSPIHQSAADRAKEIKADLPWVDWVVETKDFPNLAKIMSINPEQDAETRVDPAEYLSIAPQYNQSFQAYVPISTGCDHFCTYCIVPFSRGKEVCRPAEEIIMEIYTLINNGYKDITLLGQTVNRWINPRFDEMYKKGEIANTRIHLLNNRLLDAEAVAKWHKAFINKEIFASAANIRKGITSGTLSEPEDFLQLLQVLDCIPGEWWMSWLSSHPNYMTQPLIKFIGESVKQLPAWGGHLRPYIHFALQSGSDRILDRMNRRYHYAEFLAVVNQMRKHIPGIFLSTDIIVGFPGETNSDFTATVKAVTDCRFDMIYISEYSPRTGTAAARISDSVTPAEKAKRKQHLNDEILAPIARTSKMSLIGTTQVALIERIEGTAAHGRLANYTPVRIIDAPEVLTAGTFIKAKIEAHTDWAVEGSLQR